MQPQIQPAGTPNSFQIAVRAEPPGQYTAQVLGVPEVRATAATEQEAIDQVRQRLEAWLAGTRLVSIVLPGTPERHWVLDYTGWVDPNDPCEQAYVQELARMQQEDLERTLKEYDQECPTSSSTPIT